MTAEVQSQSLSPQSGRAHPPRKLRNYLLEPKFQLKYTGMVVGVTVLVAGVLGYQAYQYSKGQTDLPNIERMDAAAQALFPGRGGGTSPAPVAGGQQTAAPANAGGGTR